MVFIPVSCFLVKRHPDFSKVIPPYLLKPHIHQTREPRPSRINPFLVSFRFIIVMTDAEWLRNDDRRCMHELLCGRITVA